MKTHQFNALVALSKLEGSDLSLALMRIVLQASDELDNLRAEFQRQLEVTRSRLAFAQTDLDFHRNAGSERLLQINDLKDQIRQLKRQSMPPGEFEAGLQAAVIANGWDKRIQSIKFVREETGKDLKEAKDYVEAILRANKMDPIQSEEVA